MADTKIEMKVDEEIKPLKELCEKMTDIVKHEVEKGIDKVNPKELGEAIDMIKDLSEAKKYAVEALYHKQIMSAMEESEYGEDYDEDGPMERKGYRGQPRSKTSGRYMSYGDGRRSRGYMPEMYREEMMPMMGYTANPNYTDIRRDVSHNGNDSMDYDNGYSRGYEDGMRNNSSRYERARRGYKDVKSTHGMSDSDKQMKAKELDKFMNELTEDLKELVVGMSPEEKTVWKRKVDKLHEMVQ